MVLVNGSSFFPFPYLERLPLTSVFGPVKGEDFVCKCDSLRDRDEECVSSLRVYLPPSHL